MQRVQVLAQLFGNFTIRGAQLVWGESQHAAGCRPIAPASAPDSPLLTVEGTSRLDPLPVNPGHRCGFHGGFRDQFKRAGDALFVVFVPAADPKRRGTITIVHTMPIRLAPKGTTCSMSSLRCTVLRTLAPRPAWQSRAPS